MLERTPDPVPNLPLPGSAFDPRNASQDELNNLHLPARPDPSTEPALYRLWDAMFPPDVQFVSLTSVEAPRSPGHPTLLVNEARVGGKRIRRALRRRTSANWSGGYVYPRNGTRFVQVYGAWVVPDTTDGSSQDSTIPIPLPNGRGPTGLLPYRCSIWIGLDGRQRWARAMPQLGTEHHADGSARFWWQWWTPNNERFEFHVLNLDVQAGHCVRCSLSIVDGRVARFHFLNAHTKKFGTVEVCWPDHVLGTSAEWILERPGAPVVIDDEILNAGLHPLPDFGRVALSDFAAKAVPVDPVAPALEVDGQALRLVSNRSQRSDPRRNAIVSRATRDRAGSELILEYKS